MEREFIKNRESLIRNFYTKGVGGYEGCRQTRKEAFSYMRSRLKEVLEKGLA